MRVHGFMRSIGLVAVTIATIILTASCRSGGGGSGGSGAKKSGGVHSVLGKWAMAEGAVVTGKPVAWYQFNADGTFTLYNDAAFSSPHLNGTYTQKGNTIVGPFTNPGVGSGEIDATLGDDGKVLKLDFVEFWHSPPKHNLFVGSRI
jgi:hypothetical protein